MNSQRNQHSKPEHNYRVVLFAPNALVDIVFGWTTKCYYRGNSNEIFIQKSIRSILLPFIKSRIFYADRYCPINFSNH